MATQNNNIKEMKKVFLGGTCNESTWREELIPYLKKMDIEYFNSVVDDWTPECQEEEYRQKEICDIHLYLITKKMKGVFSIAEAVASCQNKRKSTLFIFTNFDGEFDDSEKKSLDAVGNLIVKLGGLYYTGVNTIEELALSVSLVVNNYKQPLSFEDRGLIMGREEEILLASKQQKYSLFSNYGDAFITGAKWADNHPKSPWISVDEDLPYNHEEYLNGSDKDSTYCVLIWVNSHYEIGYMEKYEDDEWYWKTISNEDISYPTYWMQIPLLPKNRRIKYE